MIELVEYWTATVALTQAEAAELAGLTRGGPANGRPRVIERLSPSVTAGSYQIQPGPYVGRYQLRSGQVVDVTSRFPFLDLAALLGLGRRATMLYESAAPAGSGHRLMDLIALAFAREAERIAGQGLVKTYERRSFTRPPYPGVPAVALHLKAHAGRPDRLATVANRLTDDVPLNRLIATAHRRLRTLPYSDELLTGRIRALAPVFHRIGDLAGPPPEEGTVPSQYREIYRLARLIADERTTLPVGAGVTGVSVLFNMTQIWERHVERWLRGTRPGDVVSAQHRMALTDTGPVRPVVADLVVHRDGKPVAVYDAKYRPWRSQPDTDEIYQLYTYAHRLGVTDAALVYPAQENQRSRITIGDVTIESWGLPVS